MNIKAIHNFVSECKDKLWISSEDEEVLEIKITKEMKGVLTLWVLTQIIDENGESHQRNRNITVHKETAYNYSRSKLLKKIRKKLNEQSNSKSI